MLYAIGDIHGRVDLLKQLHEKIMKHSEQFDDDHTIITLGDYVDRGPQSKEVLDFLMTKPFDGFDHIFLKGNHEDMLIKSVYGQTDRVIYHVHPHDIQTARKVFLYNGGYDTLLSFGIDNPDRLLLDNKFLSDVFAPYSEFFANLLYYYKTEKYLFVHAGIIPNSVPFDEQDQNVLLWIRDKFLNSDKDFGFRVIHGHTPTTTRGCGVYPEVKPNRIGIDTHAYETGVLTALCLDDVGNRRPEFLNTHPDD